MSNNDSSNSDGSLSDASSDELASSDESSSDDESNVVDMEFAPPKTLLADHRQFDHSRYEQLYKWLYYSHLKKGFMCKVCSVFYGDTSSQSHGSRGAWSHKGVVFKDNPGKKLRRHAKSKDHEKAILAKTSVTIEESIVATESSKDKTQANELYVGKLVQIVHFLSRNNLSVKSLYPKFVDFLSKEIQEPIIKQYLETCGKNASYSSHETCDSLIQSLDHYFLHVVDKRIKQSGDIVIYADESTSAARKEMLGIFIGSFDEKDKEFKMDFITLTEVSSTQSEIVMQAIEKSLHERNIDISQTRFSCLDGTNSMSGK